MAKSPVLDAAYPALIFKAGTLHHGALGVARTLGRLGVPIYAVVEDAGEPLSHSRYLTETFVWESSPANDEAFLNAMSGIAETIGSPAILFPVDDLSAIFVAENADTLRQWFLFPKLRQDLPRQLADKANLYSVCATLGISSARSLRPQSTADIEEFARDVGFPVVVKATEQWCIPSSGRNVVFIPNQESLFRFCESIKYEQPSRIIVQEYISGDDWIYHGYTNPESDLRVSFTGKKLLSFPPAGGATALGMSVCNDLLRRQAELLLNSISYSGIIDMDWRRDSRDGQYKLMDCNPRVGMNFRMFENHHGIDVIRAQHLDLTGRIVDNSPMIESRLFAVESYRLLSYLRGGRRATSGSAEHAHPAITSKEFAWWSNDDPLPIFAMSVLLFVRAISRRLKALWKIVAFRFNSFGFYRE